MFLRLGIVSILAGMAVTMMPATPAMASDQYIYIKPGHGPVGTKINVEGTSFTPSVISDNDSIDDTITFAKTYFPGKTTLVKTTAIDGIGNFETYFLAGEHPAGDYKVWVYDESASTPVWVSATFTLEPQIKFSKSYGCAGDNITIYGTGFAASSNATVFFDDSVITPATTNKNGSFNATAITIPEGVSMSHRIKAVDTSNNQAVSEFTTRQQLIVTPVSGSVGEEIVVSGTGFAAGKEIAVSFNYNSIETKPAAIKTGPTGSFSGKIHIPYCAANPYIVEVSDGSIKANATLEVTFGGKLNRIMGNIDSGITFNGAGFIPGRIAVVSFDEIPLTEATVDSYGRLACSFKVPASSAGEHTVSITDGTNALQRTFTVILSASVKANRNTGYVGSDIILSGTGFMSGRVATVSYDDIPLAEATTDSGGDFSTAFRIPVSSAGAHIISTTDGVNTVNATFTMESMAPPAPALLLPADADKIEPEICFIWKDVSDTSGVTYTLQVSTGANFTSGNSTTLVLEKSKLTDTEYDLSPEEKLELNRKETPYYWRVRAVDNASNVGEWSAVRTFYINTSSAPWFFCSVVAEGGIFGGLFVFWLAKKRKG